MVKHLRNPARVFLIEQATADLNCGAFGQPENAGSVGKPFPLDGTFIYGYVLQESKTTVCDPWMVSHGTDLHVIPPF